MLLALITKYRPRSIVELSSMAGRQQPNVSRSLSTLVRAGLVQLNADGRATVPTLTPRGHQLVEDLDLAAMADLPFTGDPEASRPLRNAIFEITDVKGPDGDESVEIPAKISVVFRKNGAQSPTVVTADADLNAVAERLLSHWWRLLYRRDDPFSLLPTFAGKSPSKNSILVKSWGKHIELTSSPISENSRSSVYLTNTDDFAGQAMDFIVQTAVRIFHEKRRFHTKVESFLNRIKDVLEQPEEISFCRAAGALGLSPHATGDAVARSIRVLVNFIADEDPRLDFASSIHPDRLPEALDWIASKTDDGNTKNHLEGLPDLRHRINEERREPAPGDRPWLIGTETAKRTRQLLGLGEDRALGTLASLVQQFGGRRDFESSTFIEGRLRGWCAVRNSAPVVVARQEDMEATTFIVGRAIGDYLIFGERDAPVADMYTDRQAAGRAFAAEFLAPAEGVLRMINEEDMSMSDVARHYGAKMGVIKKQYYNNSYPSA
ncbi:MAG TPA: hypothetical protein VGO20_10355 [Arenibaculum sp.]|nr:hypothetical protein [Arenibaculum sp.]